VEDIIDRVKLESFLSRIPVVLERIKTWVETGGDGDYIRKAIAAPTPKNEEAAWDAALMTINQLKLFYDFGKELESIVEMLTVALCSHQSKRRQPRASKKADARLLIDSLVKVLTFVLQFDNIKMVCPMSIRSDFSYYRRTINRIKLTKRDVNITIRDEDANKFSIFYAYPTPMMNTVNETLVNFLKRTPSITRQLVSTVFAALANACLSYVMKKQKQQQAQGLCSSSSSSSTSSESSPSTTAVVSSCIHAMTSSIILFDHINPTGAFKKSPIHIKSCIRLLKIYNDDNLLNALR